MAKKLLELLPGVKELVTMNQYTTFKVGGVADYYIEVRTIKELVAAVKAALVAKVPYFVMGNGSNILFSDYGYPGLVIKNLTSNIAIMREKSQVIADSGVILPRMIMEMVSNDLAGIEFLYGIPGTVGGAVYGNAAAHRASVGDYIKSVTVLEPDEEKIVKIVQHSAEWMEFEYRSTRLKNTKGKNKPVILTVRFQFSRCSKEELMRRINSYKETRANTQPTGLTAGSIFKNPIPAELKNITGRGTKGMPELPKERTAGFMLEKSGVKKLQVGAAEVSGLHANFIVNKGAKATEIRTLIEEMREHVRTKYGVTLQEEIEYVGQW